VIGHIAQAYRHGRLDARAGSKARRPATNGHIRAIYLLGYRDEQRRMKDRHECPQLALIFPEPLSAYAPEKQPPQMPQDRRSHPRVTPGTDMLAE
jgi:hypothetical protein